MTSVHPEGARIRTIRIILDRALMQLRAIEDPRVPIDEAEEGIADALQQAYVAMGSADDYIGFGDATTRALTGVREALRALQAVPSLDPGVNDAMNLAVHALTGLLSTEFLPDDDVSLPRPGRGGHTTRASVGLPGLIDFDRAILRPRVPLDELPAPEDPPPPMSVPPPPITSLAALEARVQESLDALTAFDAAHADDGTPDDHDVEPRSAPRVVLDDEALRESFGLAMSDDELLAARARECMEDLAMLGRMRRCLPLEPWPSGEDSEARLLTKVDALVACGVGVFPELVRLLDDRPIPDPELTFGNAFFFATIAGDDAFDQSLRIVESADLGAPSMLEMVVDAWTFSPHPRVGALLREWLTHENAHRRAVATGVLGRRSALTVREIEAAVEDDDLRVVTNAARALPTAVGHVPPGLLRRLLHHVDGSVVRAALGAGVLMRDESAAHRAVELSESGQGDFAEAAMFVAISGSSDALRVLQEDAAAGGSSTLVRALGWFGHVDFVDYLLGRLRHGDEGSAAEALGALERITGASLSEVVPEPTYDPKDEPFVRARRDYELQSVLTPDPEPWAAWWRAHQARARPRERYRFGHRWSPADNTWELASSQSVPRDREFALAELVVRTGGGLHMDLAGFVVRQRRQVSEWQRFLNSDTSVSALSGWPTRFAR